MAPNLKNPRRALSNAEILSIVLSFSQTGDAARCARVCKAWHQVALDHVWWEVKGFKALFGILAPLKQPENSKDGSVLRKPLVSYERADYGTV